MSDKPVPRWEPLAAFQGIILVLFETTLIYLVGTILTGMDGVSALRWWFLLPVVALAAFVTARLEPLDDDGGHIRPMTALIALLAIGAATVVHIRAAGGSGLVGTLLNPDEPRFTTAYIALIAATAGWWRGSQVIDIGHSDMVSRFRRGVIAVMAALGVAAIAGFGPGLVPSIDAASVNIPAWTIIFLMLGLIGLSITRITTVQGDGGRSAQWMWLRSSVLSTGAILLAGVGALSLVAAPAGSLLREATSLILFGLALLLAPLAWLVYTALEFFRSTFIPDAMVPIAPVPMATAQPEPTDPVTALPIAGGLLTLMTLMLMLLPIIILAMLIFLARRRRPAPAAALNEERESIFSWSEFGSDIGHLLGRLRRPRADTLAERLRALRGTDPATRIRRRYIQLLVRGEVAERRRRADQTPREFRPSLAPVVGNQHALDDLTDVYEQARYDPASVDQATAERADRAWQALGGEGR